MNSASLSKIYISTGFISTEKSKSLDNAIQHTSRIPEEAALLFAKDEQKAIPLISKNSSLMEKIQQKVQQLSSSLSIKLSLVSQYSYKKKSEILTKPELFPLLENNLVNSPLNLGTLIMTNPKSKT